MNTLKISAGLSTPYIEIRVCSQIGRPLFTMKVLEALLSWAFSSRLRSLSGGFLSHLLLCLLSSGSPAIECFGLAFQSLLLIFGSFRKWNSAATIPSWAELVEVWAVDIMLSDETRLALANTCSMVSDGSVDHCFRGAGSLLSKQLFGNSIPDLKGYLRHILVINHSKVSLEKNFNNVTLPAVQQQIIFLKITLLALTPPSDVDVFIKLFSPRRRATFFPSSLFHRPVCLACSSLSEACKRFKTPPWIKCTTRALRPSEQTKGPHWITTAGKVA